MDMCRSCCFACVITACRCAMETGARLFLTRHSPSLTGHRSALIPLLSPQALGWVLARLEQRRPPLVLRTPVASATPCLLPAHAPGRLALDASRHLPVGERSS